MTRRLLVALSVILVLLAFTSGLSAAQGQVLGLFVGVVVAIWLVRGPVLGQAITGLLGLSFVAAGILLMGTSTSGFLVIVGNVLLVLSLLASPRRAF